MKKLFIKFKLLPYIAPVVVLVFFVLQLALGKVPVPADSLLGLYHPWRDNSYLGFAPLKFPVKNPLTTDPIKQTYPWKFIAIDNFNNRSLPLWNPYNFSGQPLLANMQTAPFSIFNLFFIALPFKIAWTVQIISQLALGSFFMFVFLKNRNLSRTASIYGAIVLTFSGFFTAWMTWGTVLGAAIWLPLILFSIDKLNEKASVLYFITLVFALSQSLFAGHIQTTFYVYFAAIMYLLFQTISSKNLKNLPLPILSMLLALIVCAIQIIPTLEFSSLSNRDLDQTFWQGRADWFLPLKHLVQVVAPDFFGNPTTGNYWGVWNYGEFVSYIGILPLMLAILALIKADRKYFYFTILLAASLLAATESPISKLPYLIKMPLVSSFQPSRAILLVCFSLSVLSAYGLERWLSQDRSKKKLIASLIVFALLIALFIYTQLLKGNFPNINGQAASQIAARNLVIPLGLTIIGIALFSINLKKYLSVFILVVFAITIVDLFRFSYKFNSFNRSELLYPQTRTTDFLQGQTKPFRVLATDRRIADANTLSPYKIESVSGYDPIYLKSYAAFVNTWQSNRPQEATSFNRIVTPQNYESPVLDLMNVKYVLTFDDIQSEKLNLILEEGETKVYENSNALPRAFFPKEIIKVNTDQELLSQLISSSDHKNVAFSKNITQSTPNLEANAQVIEYSDQMLRIDTTSNEDAILVISNIFYPGWRAKIDGQETSIEKINYLLQSVQVPEGNHSIDLFFMPKSFVLGTYVSVFGIICSGLASLYLWRKKYQ